MASTRSPPASIDTGILLHLIVIDKRNQKILLSIKYRSFDKNPESLAISYNPFDDYNGPLTTVSKDGYRMLIEGGGWPPSTSKTAVVLFIQSNSDSSADDEPYRERMRTILNLIEKGTLDASILDTLPVSEDSEDSWLYIYILQNLLSTLGLEWVGLLDTNPLDLMKRIWTVSSSPEKEQQIRHIVFDVLGSQIERGGPTIGLDTEMMMKYETLANHIDRVHELRKGEIEQLQPILISPVHFDNGYDIIEIDLETLWYTAYGYNVLNELELGKNCDGEDFLDIQDAFSNLGITLETSTDAQRTYQPSISKTMKEYIGYTSRFNISKISPSRDGTLSDLIQSVMR